MERFYSLMIMRKRNEALIRAREEYDYIKLYKGKLNPSAPFEMEVSEGRTLYDVVGFQDTANFTISDRLRSMLSDHSVSGWKSYEIRIKDVSEKYYGLQVTGRCGKMITPKEHGFYVGYKFRYSSWDGSDLFCPDGTTLLLCTERVRELLEKYKITNIEAVDISKVEGYSFGGE